MVITAETEPLSFVTHSPTEDIWVDPPALHANISLTVDPSDDNMLSVVAVVGQNESEPAPDNGITFSYSRESLVQQKCKNLFVKTVGSSVVLRCRSVPAAIVWWPISPSLGFLDFPAVNVNVDQDNNIMFYFKHPWLLHGSSLLHLKFRKKKSNEEKKMIRIPDFYYSVKVNQVCALSGPQGSFVGSMTWFKIKKLSLKRDMRSTVIARRTQDTTRLLAVALVWSGSSQLSESALVLHSTWRSSLTVTPACVKGSCQWILGRTDTACRSRVRCTRCLFEGRKSSAQCESHMRQTVEYFFSFFPGCILVKT